MKSNPTALVCLLVLTCAACAEEPQADQVTRNPQQTIVVSKSEFEALIERVNRLERELRELRGSQATGKPTEQPAEQPIEPPEPSAPPSGGRQLLLPDISLIVQAKGKLTDDRNDPDRQKLLLAEAELGIQGYVYPNVKADAFITGSPAEGEPFQVEEAYLTYLGLRKGLNLYVGRKHVAFGRTNLLHCHSWLYARQPLVLGNFVAPESLSGQGAAISYLIPTRSDLFAQLDLGTWANGTSGEESNPPEIMVGPGANVTDRFNTARLWTSCPVGGKGELELGGSYLDGKSDQDPATLQIDYVHIRGVDLSYRYFGEGDRRLLLRGEYLRRRGTTDSNRAAARGYYLFGNYRTSKYNSVGLLYDWSEFPQATNLHESALSLIYTRQFSEQYYLRLQAIHGNRPDCGSFTEFWLQWCWGVGPHTHNLE